MFKTLLVNYHPKHQVWACCCLLMLKVISNRSSKKSIGSKIHSMLIVPVFKCPTSVMKIMFKITRLPPWALQDLWCKRLKSGTLFQSDFLSQAMWFYIKTAQFALNIMCKDKNCWTKTEMEDARNHGWRVICSDQAVQKKENTLDTVDTTLITYLNINQSKTCSNLSLLEHKAESRAGVRQCWVLQAGYTKQLKTQDFIVTLDTELA